MSIYNGIWNVIGRQYEVLVYERSRLAHVATQRQAQALELRPPPDTNLPRKIELTEQIMAALAELKEFEK